MEQATEKKVLLKIRNIDNLPTLPVIYEKLSHVLDDPRSSAEDVSRVIENDQALSTKLLKVVNSAFFGFPQKISSISHAAVILGFREIYSVALSISIIAKYGKDNNTGFNHQEFWQHALAVGICANLIAKRSPNNFLQESELCFTSGIIHDIGKVVLDQFFQEEYSKVIKMVETESITLLAAEEKVFEFNHQDIGYLLCGLWNLPQFLQSAVGFHNYPLKKRGVSQIFPLVSAVHVADSLVRAMEIGYGGDDFVPEPEKLCWECLGLKPYQIEPLMTATKNETQKLCEFML